MQPTKTFQSSRSLSARSSYPMVPSYGYAYSGYSGVGDKDQDYLVTSDGEVYSWRGAWFGLGNLWGSKYYYFKYSALTGQQEDTLNFPLADESVPAMVSKVVGSWNDFSAAKAYAKSIVEARQQAATTGKPVVTPVDPINDPRTSERLKEVEYEQKHGGKKKPEKEGGKINPWLLGGIVTGGVALLGAVIYFAQKNQGPQKGA